MHLNVLPHVLCIITKTLFHKLREIQVNISDGIWHHICFAWTLPWPLKVYKDGQEAGKVADYVGTQSVPGKTKLYI